MPTNEYEYRTVTSDSDPKHVMRLRHVFGYAYESVIGNNRLHEKIKELRDDDGILSVSWRRRPSRFELWAVEEALKIFGSKDVFEACQYSATAYEESTSRIERLHEVVGYAIGMFSHDPINAVKNLRNVHDYKGFLTVTWEYEPLFPDKEAFRYAWGSPIGDGCGEDPMFVEHRVLNPGVYREYRRDSELRTGEWKA